MQICRRPFSIASFEIPVDRSSGRNVQFYDATSPEAALGGMIQNGSATAGNFLDMLGILLITQSPIRVRERDSGHIVTTTNTRLEAGHYDIYCGNLINVNDEPWVFRLISHNVSGRDGAFMTGIRARDGRCVISGVINPRLRIERGAVDSWEFGRWITDMDDTNGVSKINSLQNGILLRVDIHQLFDQYLISVNPDDGYKVVVFDDDHLGLDGRVLDPVCRDPNNAHRVLDELLRWHFRQSVLANMRGAGEPIFEHDFSGGDMIGVISKEPYAKERLEMEVATRLRGQSV
ncbi:hypothetical protein L211DRAFT_889904 [Terfezia boudieri ATCC MYA-4762]|uniref:Uncharacterized protein n=2 Tax=Terfezia boudieri ATCC MYA-4762 TaxID=1051890 RepID=A0A3N4L4V3_9PEZI|nr:hypothetical protein L211DRAFT_863957 [Terfezia boudieri ATCC MYA-4762]RPB17920.1 hypothetical protein L211DRAFT_889904 [Terfezia boudieri ATCC MYA-4762]